VKPAPGFALFATQNPAGVCAASDATHGGRKPLSRAFRDRFVEIHVDELSGGELADVVARVGGVAPSLAARLVDDYERLRRLRLRWARDGGSLFEGNQSLCSSRDVLKWAARFGGDGDGLLALAVGDAIVAQRLRCDADVVAVRRELAAALGVDAGARSTS
jgi:midasin